MSDIVGYLTKLSQELLVLEQDVSKIIANAKSNKGSSDKINVVSSKKSLMSLTTIRKDKNELNDAKENPDSAFVMDRLKTIFKA